MGGGPNGTGGRPLFILTIEDDPVDHELVIRILERSGIPVRLRTAETLEAFGAALDETMPDVVISDYNLRGFTGMEAFALLRRRDPDVPFILLTGSLDEATAVECMKAGVDDYVLKARLGPHLLPGDVLQRDDHPDFVLRIVYFKTGLRKCKAGFQRRRGALAGCLL
jgi:CheY-like chemotaxis protein